MDGHWLKSIFGFAKQKGDNDNGGLTSLTNHTFVPQSSLSFFILFSLFSLLLLKCVIVIKIVLELSQQHCATEPTTLNVIVTIFAKQEGNAMVIIATELHCIDS